MGITEGGHSVEGTVGKHLVCFDIFKLAQLFFVIAGHHVW